MSDEQLIETVFDVIRGADNKMKIDAKFVCSPDILQRLKALKDSDGRPFVSVNMNNGDVKLCGFPIEVGSSIDGEIKLVPANTIISNINNADFHSA